MRKLLTILILGALLSFGTTVAQTLVIAQGTDAVTLDAADITDSPSATVSEHIVETLFELTAEGNIEPLLAEGYEVNEDGTVWTLSLRQGINFHDGTPFNAEAVKFNIDRFIDPANAFQFRFLLARIQNVEVVDEYTVQITLSTPFAPFLAHLTHSATGIQSPAAIEQHGEDYGTGADFAPVGTGPFRFSSWERGQSIEVTRYDDYWGEPGGVEAIRFLAVSESGTRMAMVETGQAHVAVRVPTQDVARLNALADVTVENVSSLRTIYIYFNHNIEPFTDVRVRRAMNYAVDKEEIAEFLLGGAVRPSDAPISPGIFGYTSIGTYEFNPERARELLAEAGFPDGFSTSLYCPTGRYLQDIQICEAIQPQLAAVGINAEIETLEWAAYLELTGRPASENTVPFAMLGWGTVTGDADYGLFALFHTSEHVPAGSNRAFYSNVMVDDLLDEARTNPNPSLREQLYQDAMEIIWNDAPWLFLHSETQLVAVRDNVEGLIIHPAERIIARDATLR